MANYFCQGPRQLLMKEMGDINRQFSEWCMMEHIPKPITTNITERDQTITEPSFKARSSTTLTLFNYLTYINFRSEQDLKKILVEQKKEMKILCAPYHTQCTTRS